MSSHIGILFGNSFINVSMYLNRIVSVDKWAKSLNLCGAILIVFVFTEWVTHLTVLNALPCLSLSHKF
jgi:hypothetical protein